MEYTFHHRDAESTEKDEPQIFADKMIAFFPPAAKSVAPANLLHPHCSQPQPNPNSSA